MGSLIWITPYVFGTGGDPEVALSAGTESLQPAWIPHIIIWLVVGCWVALSFVHRLPTLPRIVFESPLRWYLLFILVAVVSIYVSSNRTYSAFFAFKLLVTVGVMVLLLERNRDWADLIDDLLFVYFVQWVAIVLLFVLSPTIVGQATPSGYRLTGGPFADYGSAALLGGLWCLTRALSRQHASRWLSWSGVSACAIFVILSRTRSTIAGAALVALVCVLLHPGIRVRFAAIWLVVAISASALFVGVGPRVTTFLLRGQQTSELSALSGRSDAFDYLIDRWEERPLVGYGFAVGSRAQLTMFSRLSGLGIAAAHDALSKVLVDTGIVGAFFLIMTLVGTVARAFSFSRLLQHGRLSYEPVARLVALLLWLVTASVVGGGIADVSVPFAAVVVIAAAVVPSRRLTGSTQRPILGSSSVAQIALS